MRDGFGQAEMSRFFHAAAKIIRSENQPAPAQGKAMPAPGLVEAASAILD
jgi:hypothetical protein